MYKYYTCFDCGGQVLIGSRGCLPCLQQKTLKRMADEQEAENHRSREREREREREAYYERMRQRDAQRDADPEYQERLARRQEEERIRRENEYWAEFDRIVNEAVAKSEEKARWDALTSQQQAAEIELKTLRETVTQARLDLYCLFRQTPECGSIQFGSLGSDPQAVIDEIAKIKNEIAVIEIQTDRLRKIQRDQEEEKNKEALEKIKKVALVIAAMVAYTIVYTYIKV